MISKKKLLYYLTMGLSLITINTQTSEKSTSDYRILSCIKQHPILSTISASLNGYGIATLIKNRKLYEHYYKELFRKGNTTIAQCSIAAGSLLFAMTYGRYCHKVKKSAERSWSYDSYTDL
jgi:hypothetical protein